MFCVDRIVIVGGSSKISGIRNGKMDWYPTRLSIQTTIGRGVIKVPHMWTLDTISLSGTVRAVIQLAR